MQPDDPLFSKRSAAKAAIVALLSAANLACQLYSPYVNLHLRLALACLSLAIVVFAANTDLHLSNNAPIVTTGSIETVNVANQSPPPGSPSPPPRG